MSWVKTHPFVSAICLLLVVGLVAAIVAGQNKTPDWITATVETGSVSEVVSVSGKVAATTAANLSFPAQGVVSSIAVARGDVVEPGAILATIGNAAMVAERAQALASVAEAQALRAELQAGVTTETQLVSETTVANAKEALARSQAIAREQVESALIALRSSDLEALAIDPDENSLAPVVSGSYTCVDDGTYTLSVYRSNSESGYSYQLDGLESGQFTVTTNQPSALGSCGLFIQFSDGESYEYSEWQINIPNQRSSTYLTRRNAYTLALTQAEQNVAAARDALRLAEDQAAQTTAGARVEALIAATARIEQAQARVRAIDAQLADFALVAPFAGIVTTLPVSVGETVRGETVVTLLNADSFELVARIPEIDITRLAVGQLVQAQFDANRDEMVDGVITFVAPEAVEIDGVGYFEAVIDFTNPPDWLRAGLNADVAITIAEQTDVLRLPQRFVIRDEAEAYVLRAKGNTTVRQPVELGLLGNDGFVEVRNLELGTIVVAP